MPTDEPYVVVHGGVHKTASSAVQAVLKRNQGKLLKQGVRYIHHREARLDYTNPVQLNGYLRLGLDFKPNITDDDLKKLVGKFWKNVEAQPGERVILSDENMPGHSGHCVRRGRLYWRRTTLIPAFADNIPYPVREVHIALRNYADFFASAYVEFLRSATGARLFPENQMKRNVLSEMESWTRFLEEVQEAFPQAQLYVWRFEDFKPLFPRIVESISGNVVPHADMAVPKRKRGRPSASHKAVQVMLEEIERFGGDHALARRVEIQEEFPRGPDYPGYDPWSQAERDHLTRMYDRDVAEIRRRLDVTYLEPDP